MEHKDEMKPALDRLADVLLDEAIKACSAWWRHHKIEINQVDHAEASKVIKKHIAEAIAEGLFDARQAHEAGMNQIAIQTLLASMRLAGIKAAQEIVKYGKTE